MLFLNMVCLTAAPAWFVINARHSWRVIEKLCRFTDVLLAVKLVVKILFWQGGDEFTVVVVEILTYFIIRGRISDPNITNI
jgi:hypothetical protein